MNISKELINAVLNVEIKDVYFAPNGMFFETQNEIGDNREYTNDFFFKCKEWAASKGFELFSTRLRDKKRIAYNCSLYGYYGDEEDFNSTSEQQAVFDACQWILKNMGKTC